MLDRDAREQCHLIDINTTNGRCTRLMSIPNSNSPFVYADYSDNLHRIALLLRDGLHVIDTVNLKASFAAIPKPYNATDFAAILFSHTS